MKAELSRKTRPMFSVKLALALGALVAPVAALADDEPAQLQEGLEENGLQEKTPRTAKAEPADPDPTQAGKVETRRKETRDLLNKFQEEVGHKTDDLTAADAKAWDKIVAEADKLVAGFQADDEKFLEAHRGLLEQYQAAFNSGKADESAKVAKAVAKLRTDLLAKLDKLTKQADKVKGDWAKLEARIQKNAGK